MLPRISNTNLKGIGKRHHACVVHDIKGKCSVLTFNFISCRISEDVLYQVEKVFLYSYFAEHFYHKSMMHFVKGFI